MIKELNNFENQNIIKDKIPVRGHFKIESFDKNGKLIDFHEDHNLIMNGARTHFMKLLSGSYDTNKVINRFVLGTKGIVGDNDSLPKTAEDGFVATLTDLFCGTKSPQRKILFEELTFNPTGSIENQNANNVTDFSNNTSTVNIIVNEYADEPQITYIFNITDDAFNGSNDYMKYNEAGLFADDTLIAMRTFKTKTKDSTISLRITWSLIF